jgi:hypothetical protein
MDKRTEPLTVFRWQKDEAGYEFGPHPTIVRRGGVLKEYDPVSLTVPPHRIFATIQAQVRGFAETVGRQLSDDPGAPFEKRAFQTFDDALLGFVNEFGFVEQHRADAEEDAYRLMQLVGDLRALTAWTTVAGSKHPELSAVLSLPFVGPNLRMYLGPGPRTGRMQLHYQPETLYAWMWLETARDLSNGVDWSGPPCLLCFSAIGRGRNNRTARAEFCNSRCRVSFHRLSKAEQEKRREEARAFARNQPERLT